MSSLTDFLFNGQPPAATTTYGTATTGLPQWYSDYQQGILGAANAVAAEPYQQYGGQRVAGLTQDQNTAVANTRNQAGDWGPSLGNANALAAQAGNTSASAAGAGNLNAAAGMSGIGAAQGDLNAATSLNGASAAAPYVNGATQQNGASAAQPWQTAAAGQNGANAAHSALSAASGINATGAAQPFANNAGPASGGIDSYMNPYNDAVTNRIGQLAGRNLSENLMPAIGDDFMKAGQFGSSRMQYQVGNALRDTQESALAAQSQALQQGFGVAAQNAQADATRQAGLAGTMGNIANQQQSNLAQIGQTQGNLTNAYGQTLAGIGQTQGNLTNTYGANLNQAGQTMGTLTGQNQTNLINAGNIAGTLTNTGQQTLAGIGQTQGNLASADSQNQNNAAKTTGALAQQYQTQQLADNAALMANGNQQQALDQTNLNTAYGDFQNQVNYPKQQVGFLSDVAHGIGNPGSATTTTATAPASTYNPSGLASIAGSLSTAGALSKYLG